MRPPDGLRDEQQRQRHEDQSVTQQDQVIRAVLMQEQPDRTLERVDAQIECAADDEQRFQLAEFLRARDAEHTQP